MLAARQLERRDRRALAVGVETVRTHARNIYRKLGVTSRLELAEASPRARAPDVEAPRAPLHRASGSRASVTEQRRSHAATR